MQTYPDPVRPANDAARKVARDLLASRHAALAWTDPETGTPGISRIAFCRAPDTGFLTLMSALAAHHAALLAHPDCAVMPGEPGTKGDPLAHPRLMIRARAVFVAIDASDRPVLRDHWLRNNPKATLYVDFADFTLVRLIPVSALLNAGFARAFHLAPADFGE